MTYSKHAQFAGEWADKIIMFLTIYNLDNEMNFPASPAQLAKAVGYQGSSKVFADIITRMKRYNSIDERKGRYIVLSLTS